MCYSIEMVHIVGDRVRYTGPAGAEAGIKDGRVTQANPPQYTVIRTVGPSAGAADMVPQQTHEITQDNIMEPVQVQFNGFMNGPQAQGRRRRNTRRRTSNRRRRNTRRRA
jgi:hypothetical protein